MALPVSVGDYHISQRKKLCFATVKRIDIQCFSLKKHPLYALIINRFFFLHQVLRSYFWGLVSFLDLFASCHVISLGTSLCHLLKGKRRLHGGIEEIRCLSKLGLTELRLIPSLPLVFTQHLAGPQVANMLLAVPPAPYMVCVHICVGM